MLEFFTGLFILPTLITWAIIAVIVLALAASTIITSDRSYDEGSSLAAFIFGPVAITAFLFLNVKGFQASSLLSLESWKYLLPGIVVYGIVGGLWSVFKWFTYIWGWERRQMSQMHKQVEMEKKMLDDPKKYRNDLIELDAPSASRNKGQITFWIAYWPFSLIGTAFHNIIEKFLTNIRRFFTTLYNSISDRSAERVRSALNVEMSKVLAAREQVLQETRETEEAAVLSRAE